MRINEITLTEEALLEDAAAYLKGFFRNLREIPDITLSDVFSRARADSAVREVSKAYHKIWKTRIYNLVRAYGKPVDAPVDRKLAGLKHEIIDQAIDDLVFKTMGVKTRSGTVQALIDKIVASTASNQVNSPVLVDAFDKLTALSVAQGVPGAIKSQEEGIPKKRPTIQNPSNQKLNDKIPYGNDLTAIEKDARVVPVVIAYRDSKNDLTRYVKYNGTWYLDKDPGAHPAYILDTNGKMERKDPQNPAVQQYAITVNDGAGRLKPADVKTIDSYLAKYKR